jgi:hypothetical protein
MTSAETSPTGAGAIKDLCRFFVANVVFLGLFAGFNFVIDPLQSVGIVLDQFQCVAIEIGNHRGVINASRKEVRRS